MPRKYRRLKRDLLIDENEEFIPNDNVESMDSGSDMSYISVVHFNEEVRDCRNPDQEEEYNGRSEEGIKGLISDDLLKLSALIEAGVTLKGADRILSAFDKNNDTLRRFVHSMGSKNSQKLRICTTCGEMQEENKCNRCNTECVELISAEVVPQLEEIEGHESESPVKASIDSKQIDVTSFYHMYLLDADGSPITPSDELLLQVLQPGSYVDSTYLEHCDETFQSLKMFSRVSHEISRGLALFVAQKNTTDVQQLDGNRKTRRRSCHSSCSPFPPLEGKTFDMIRSMSLKGIVQCPIRGTSISLHSGAGGSLSSFDIRPSPYLPEVCSKFCRMICLQIWTSEDFLRLTGSSRSARNKHIPLPETFMYEVRALFIAAWELRDLSNLQLMELSDKIRGGFSDFFDNERNKLNKLIKSKRLSNNQDKKLDIHHRSRVIAKPEQYG